MLDDGSDLWDRPSALLWDAYASAVPASEFLFRATVLASMSSLPCRLQSAVRGAVSLAGGFREFSVSLPFWSWWIACLRAVFQTLLGYLIFSLRKDT